MSERSVGGVRTMLTRKRTRVAVAAATVTAGLLLGGCSAGQITQTDTQSAAVNGAHTDIGHIGLRDVQLAYPDGKQPAYKHGSDARVVLTVVNDGSQDDQLAGVSSPWFGGSRIKGDKNLPARSELRSGVDKDDRHGKPGAASSGSDAPSGKGPTHQVAIDLTGLKKPALRPGVTVPVQFKFSVAGKKTVQVPIGAPEDGSQNNR